jgi:hypothetical protein
LTNSLQEDGRYRQPNITEFAEIAEFANIAEFFEIYISNYFLSVRIDFLKSSLFNFYLIAFGGVFNSTHIGDLLHTNLL